MRPWIPSFALLLTITVLLAGSSPARATCNVIPKAQEYFHGYLGFADRPFAGPGDLIELGLSSRTCSAASLPTTACWQEGATPSVDDLIVTLFYKPLKNGTKHAAVLAKDCTTIDLSGGCGTGIPAEKTICIPAASLGLTFDDGEAPLSLHIPNGFCEGGNREYLPCQTSSECDGGTCNNQDPASPLTGPLTIAVTCATQGPPCYLADQTCRDVFEASGPKPDFCLDHFYSVVNDTCDVEELNESFPNFTALPPANDFSRVCTDQTDSPDCDTGPDKEVSFALNDWGDALIPFSWGSVLEPDVTMARLARASTSFPAKKNTTERIDVPPDFFTESYTRRGARLPALFEPQVSFRRPNEFTLFGTVDAEHSVLRVVRRARKGGMFKQCVGGTEDGKPCMKRKNCKGGGDCVQATCQGGTKDGDDCKKDKDCPGGQCGADLFSFAEQANPDFGPVRITRAPNQGKICDGSPSPQTALDPGKEGQPCIQPGDGCDAGGECCDYRASAEEHIPLGPIESSEDLRAFVLDEKLLGRDFNGDGDDDDSVLTVRDRESGELLQIGVGSECTPSNSCPIDDSCERADGRAVVMLEVDGPHPNQKFEFPAISVGEGVIAFIEKAAAQCAQGAPHCHGDRLRVYKRVGCAEGPMLQEITTGPPITPRLDRVIDGWPLQFSKDANGNGGSVFFRDACDVLYALRVDPSSGEDPQPRLGPATRVATADGKAALLRPETTACSDDPSVILNGDGDKDDEVVHLWGGAGAPVNLGCAASELDMSGKWVGVLVSEMNQPAALPAGGCPAGQGQGDLNGDGDCADQVVHVIETSQAAQIQCADPSWRNVGEAGKKIGVSGEAVAYIRPESNLMQVHFAGSDTEANLSMTAVDYVLGEPDEDAKCHLLAFRTRESVQNQGSLNDVGGDNDTNDDVFQLYELMGGEEDPTPDTLNYWLNTKQAVTACGSMACDPRKPYQVDGRWVRFLTDECQQGGTVQAGCPAEIGPGTDLDGDGAANSVVMQMMNACEQNLFPTEIAGSLLPASAVSAARIRVDSIREERFLLEDEPLPEQVVSFAMAGRCIESLRRRCNPEAESGPLACPSGAWCEAEGTRRLKKVCYRSQGVCLSSEDCPGGLECQLDQTKVFFLGPRQEP